MHFINSLPFHSLSFFRLIEFISVNKVNEEEKTKKKKSTHTHSHQAHWHRLSADILWVARDYRRSLVFYRSFFRYHLFKLFLLLVSSLSQWLLFISVFFFHVWTVYYLILASSLSHRQFSGYFSAQKQTWNSRNRKHV